MRDAVAVIAPLDGPGEPAPPPEQHEQAHAQPHAQPQLQHQQAAVVVSGLHQQRQPPPQLHQPPPYPHNPQQQPPQLFQLPAPPPGVYRPPSPQPPALVFPGGSGLYSPPPPPQLQAHPHQFHPFHPHPQGPGGGPNMPTAMPPLPHQHQHQQGQGQGYQHPGPGWAADMHQQHGAPPPNQARGGAPLPLPHPLPHHPIGMVALPHDPRPAKYKTQLCRNIQLGQCRFGDMCLFAHDASELRPVVPPAPAPAHAATPGPGNSGAALHHQLRALNLGDPVPSSYLPSKGHAGPPGTGPDRSLANRNQRHGHGPHTPKPAEGSKFRTRLCKHYTSGTVCPFGTACTFAHGEEELAVASERLQHRPLAPKNQPRLYKTKMCRHIQNGLHCPFGEGCTFAHSNEELLHHRTAATAALMPAVMPTAPWSANLVPIPVPVPPGMGMGVGVGMAPIVIGPRSLTPNPSPGVGAGAPLLPLAPGGPGNAPSAPDDFAWGIWAPMADAAQHHQPSSLVDAGGQAMPMGAEADAGSAAVGPDAAALRQPPVQTQRGDDPPPQLAGGPAGDAPRAAAGPGADGVAEHARVAGPPSDAPRANSEPQGGTGDGGDMLPQWQAEGALACL